MALPSAYKEVEYIQSSGTQYINTGYLPNTNTSRIYTKFEPVSMGSGASTGTYQNPLFGTRTSDYNYETCLRASISSQNYNVGVSMDGTSMADATPSSLPKYAAGTVIELDYGRSGGTYNSFSWTWNAQFQGSPVYNLLIFGIWSAGSVDSRKFRGKLYSFKIWEGNTLVRDYVPCYRKSDNVTGMYDLVNDQFYTNAGTGTFIRGPIKDRGIPNDYTLVECIESSGTQYIDTGYIPNNNTKIECTIGGWNTGTGQYGTMFGTRLEWSSSGRGFMLDYDSTNSRVLYMFGGGYNPSVGFSFPSGGEHTIEFSLGGAYEDGTLRFTPSSATFTSPANLYISALNDNGTAKEFGGFKLYSCKIWDNGTLYRDMVPVIRNSDSKPGMYDIVTDTFYTNAGTGEFNYKKYPESGKIKKIYIGVNQSRPSQSFDFYYSDDNWNEYQSLVSSVGSVKFSDTGKRYRFQNPCYIGDRTAVNVNGTTFSKINLDTLTVISSKSSTVNGRIWYFGNNRILTRSGIMDFDGNMVTSFSTTYRMITPGLPGEVWSTDDSYNMYKGVVDGDNVTFTKVGTSTSNSGIGASAGEAVYGRLGMYSLGATENSTHYIGFHNASTGTFSTITANMGNAHASGQGLSMPDGKMYKHTLRDLQWGRLYRIGTSAEGVVGSGLSSSWTAFGTRFGKFLGNIVSGGMSSQNGTGTGYGSNNYFINSSGTVTLVQSNAFPYDTNIYSSNGFVDENGWIYPNTSGGGTGVILKTDKTFTDFPWWNPYLYR